MFEFLLSIIVILGSSAVIVAWIRVEAVERRAALTNKHLPARLLVMTGLFGGALGAGSAGLVIAMAPDGGAIVYVPLALVYGTIPGVLTGWLLAKHRARKTPGDVRRAD